MLNSLADINKREGIAAIANLHTLDTERSYCERTIGMAGYEVAFGGPPDKLTSKFISMTSIAFGHAHVGLTAGKKTDRAMVQ